MADVVHHYAKSFDRSDTEQIGIAWLRKHDLVNRLEILRSKDRIAYVSLNDLRGCRRKRALSDGLDSCCRENISRQPSQLGTCIYEGANGSSTLLLILRIHGDDIDVKCTH